MLPAFKRNTHSSALESGEHGQERAAQVQAQRKLKQHDGDGAHQALAEGVAQDDTRMRGIDAVIDLPPHADRDPRYHRPAQQQDEFRRR
jgi:hypothetical protein